MNRGVEEVCFSSGFAPFGAGQRFDKLHGRQPQNAFRHKPNAETVWPVTRYEREEPEADEKGNIGKVEIALEKAVAGNFLSYSRFLAACLSQAVELALELLGVDEVFKDFYAVNVNDRDIVLVPLLVFEVVINVDFFQ
jgi:hypothetical protein